MQKGTYISGLGHLGVIGWAIIGGYVSSASTPTELQVSDVSIISEAAFAAMISDAPDTSSDVFAPVAPELTETPVEAPSVEEPPVTEDATAPEAPQDAGTAPDMSAILDVPETDVQDQAPESINEAGTDQVGETLEAPTAPIADVDRNGQKAPDQLAMVVPAEAAAPRVDTEAAPKPPTDAETSDETENASTPDADATEVADETIEQAPDQASTEIITEDKAQDSTVAPVKSSRPPGRPARRVEKPSVKPPKVSPADEIAAALAAAQADNGASTPKPAVSQPASSGPPLTSGEKDGLRLAVQKCWNVGSLSSEALRVTVTVAVSLNIDGKPEISTLRMLSSSDGSNAAALQAYETARRAIIRCGAKGFDLPADKYDHWRDVEMTFNPEKMRIK